VTSLPLPVRETRHGLVVAVRLTPGAGRGEIGGLVRHGDKTVLAVRVTAAPEKGRANAALIALLARRLSLPKSSLSLAGGGRTRDKRIVIGGDADAVRARIAALIDELGEA